MQSNITSMMTEPENPFNGAVPKTYEMFRLGEAGVMEHFDLFWGDWHNYCGALLSAQSVLQHFEKPGRTEAMVCLKAWNFLSNFITFSAWLESFRNTFNYELPSQPRNVYDLFSDSFILQHSDEDLQTYFDVLAYGPMSEIIRNDLFYSSFGKLNPDLIDPVFLI